MSDLGAVAKDMASAVARGAEKGGKAIVEHYKSIGKGLLKSSALHKDVENDIQKNAENIGKDVGKDVEKDARQEGETAAKDAKKSLGTRIKNGLKRIFHRKGADDDVGCRPGTNDPIDVATGAVLFEETDVSLPGVLPLVLERTHRSSMDTGRWFGSSWMSSLDQRLLVTPDRIIGAFADGRVLNWTHPNGAPDAAVVPSSGALWPLRHDRDGSYSVHDPQRGLTWRFEYRDGYEAADEEDTELPLVSVTDRVGHEITFSYDEGGRPLSVSHSCGYRVQVSVADDHVTGLTLAGRDGEEDLPLRQFTYDDDGNLSDVLNFSGLMMRFTYDDAGRMTSWTDSNGHSYRYSYDDEGRCIRGDGPGDMLSCTLTYEPGITRTTDAAGAVTTYEITESGQLAATTDPLGNTTRWERDSRGRVTTRIDSLGRITRYAYDDRGNLTAVTRADGSQATTEYDEFCLPVLLTDPDGATWRQEYDEHGNPTLIEAPDGSVTRFRYDNRGHLAEVTDSDGTITSITCDAAGLPAEVVGPDDGRTRYETDMAGRVIRVIGPDDGVTSLNWMPDGKPVSRVFPDGARESWEWDNEGNLIRHVSPADAVTAREYGPFDTTKAITWPDGTHIEFGYDHEQRLTRVDLGGLTWRYEYDPAGRLAAETDYNGATTSYDWDAAGQLTRKANAVGQETAFRYDPLGKLSAQVSGDAETAFRYDAVGRLVLARNAVAEVTWDRDELGRVTAETCNGRTVRTSYDAEGRAIGRVTPSGASTAWSYGAAGLPTAMTVSGQVLRFSYDQSGQEINRALPGGVTLTQDWDPLGRLASQAITGPDRQLLQRRAYSYNPDGFVIRAEDLLTGTRAFGLDPSGRVTAVTGTEWQERYAYDPVGNLTEASWPAEPPSVTDGWPDAGAQGVREVRGTLVARAGNVRYRYDAAGRVISRARSRVSRKPDTWRYEWDADNRLVAVTTPDGTVWRYHYDPLGRRIAKLHLDASEKVLGETWFTWDGAVLAEQVEVTRDREQVITTWDYQPGSFAPVSQQSRSLTRDPANATQDEIDHEFYAIVTNLADTPSELIAPDGTVAGYQQQTLWGGTVWRSSGVSTPLRFPGQYNDPETGLSYNNQRYYDPITGSYLSPDPLGLTPTPNPHSYVPNPHTFVDPLGLKDCKIGGDRDPDFPSISKTNWRGRFNARLNKDGFKRLPKDWDAHHAIPQEYRDHPEFKDFDFDHPSNIRGVPGSSMKSRLANLHQDITNHWRWFKEMNPSASRTDIEGFAKQIDRMYGAYYWAEPK